MSTQLEALIQRVSEMDEKLASDITLQLKRASNDREFGLVFNRHMPERVELYGRAVRRGDKVRVIGEDAVHVVLRARGRGSSRTAELLSTSTGEKSEVAVSDLVVVADFDDPIYPGLRSTGKVERGGDKPFHAVINAENYHALRALQFSHHGKVDCIYIDPPYNTGAKDWKYNNDYVDGEDSYRHSKWLAFMERRLREAKSLLNPKKSVLIATIDEKEVHRLGLLLEQVFPTATIQMVSIAINPSGVSRKREFSRSDEYAFFVLIGDAAVIPQTLGEEWGFDSRCLYWRGLQRAGSNSLRSDRPNLFYPIFVSEKDGRINSFGSPLRIDEDISSVEPPDGCLAVFPFNTYGIAATWQLSHTTAKEWFDSGFLKVGAYKGTNTTFQYLAKGERKKVEDGLYGEVTYSPDGYVQVSSDGLLTEVVPLTQWGVSSHNASVNGSSLLRKMMPARKFPYPKSLYAVEDCLRFFISDNPAAVVVDFFGGSGTTAHAVMRLNRQDGGHRQSITITNNEVSVEEQKALRKKGFRQGDNEWEQWGICEYITKPRVTAAVTGKTPEGEPIKGNYTYWDEFPMSEGFEENVEFFDLTYEDPERVHQGEAYEAVSPLLWLRAGAESSRETDPGRGFSITDSYAILFNPDMWREFTADLRDKSVRCVYVVTDIDAVFDRVKGHLPDVDTVRLYEDFLSTFKFTTGS